FYDCLSDVSFYWSVLSTAERSVYGFGGHSHYRVCFCAIDWCKNSLSIAECRLNMAGADADFRNGLGSLVMGYSWERIVSDLQRTRRRAFTDCHARSGVCAGCGSKDPIVDMI